MTADYPTREERYAATVLPFIRKVCTCHLFSSDREPHNAGCETLVSARRLAAALVAADPAPAQPDAGLSDEALVREVQWRIDHFGSPEHSRYDSLADAALSAVREHLAARAAQPVPAPDDGVTQTILSRPDLIAQDIYGNCMQAAIATVLRKPLDAVPHFGAFAYWPGALRLWLRGEGMDYTVVRGSEIPEGRAMLCGKSPRGTSHAVVSEGGQIVWDPHPSRAGLTTVKGAYLIHEWDTSEPIAETDQALMEAPNHTEEDPVPAPEVSRGVAEVKAEALHPAQVGICAADHRPFIALVEANALDDVDRRLTARIGEGRDDPETAREGSYFAGFLDGLESARAEVRWKRPDPPDRIVHDALPAEGES